MKIHLIVPLAFVLCVSCASLTPAQPSIERLPDVAQTFDGPISAAIDQALTSLEQAVTIEERAAFVYLSKIAPSVPATIDAQVKASFRALSDLIIGAVASLKRGVTEWAKFRELLQPIVTATNHLAEWIRLLTPSATSSLTPVLSDLIGTIAKAALQRGTR